VGAALAASGTVYQGLFRNPMADPYTVSASQGAALGAAIAIVLGVGTAVFGTSTVPIFAFIGSLISVLVVYTISRVGSKVPISTLLLSGIAVGIFEMAIITYLQTIADDKLGHLTFWLIGSLNSPRTTWMGVLSILPFIVVGIIISYLYSRDLNLFTLGEDQAQHLGVNLERSKFILLISGAFMTGAAVSISGLLGFIGLMIPHLTRILVGPDHRVLLAASVLLGGSYLAICDGLARVLNSANEVPVGVLTSIFGVIFFLYLLRRKKKIDSF
jgi:iron complex transport system permease protein